MNDTEKQKIREEWNETQFTNNIWANKDVVDVEQDNICDYWLSILDKTIKSKLEAVEGEINHIAHFSKLAGSRYDGYVDCKEVLEIINKHK
jgi:hypothetical protein